MEFTDKSIIDNQLRVLRKGDWITVIGQIESASPHLIGLINCELETETLAGTNQAAPRLSELKALCSHLADELEDAHKTYENEEQKIASWASGFVGSGVSESDFEQQVESTRDENLRRTLNKYDRDLKGRLLKLYDTLAARGWLGDVDRSRFENLIDPYQMRDLAKRLRDVCNKLPGG